MTSSRRLGDSAISGTTRQQSKSLVRTWLIWQEQGGRCERAGVLLLSLLSSLSLCYLQYPIVGPQAALLRWASGADVAHVDAAIQQTVRDAEAKVLQV